VDRTDFFKTDNSFGWNGEGTDWYNSLHGKKIYGSYSELTVSLLVSVRIVGLANFWNN
jgi:hypothetical protein